MAVATAVDQISYNDLYARWEQGNWSASELDFSRDREQWLQQLTERERRSALWTYSMFFHGEDSVADNLSPFIDAAPREEQKYFLATQQVDEARHAVLFGRFMREVAGAGSDLASSLQATSGGLTWGFRKVFSRLDRMADELRRDRSKPKLAQAITLYHLVIESSLAQPGQHFIEESLSRRELLPAFREGIGNVSRDEQRHIAFGVKMISELVREDPDCEPAIEELLRELLPYTAAVFVPPGWDESYVTDFGFELLDLYTHGLEAFEGRLRAAGLHPERMRLGLAFDLPSRERAQRTMTLLRAGYLGEPEGPVTRDPAATEIMFDSIVRSVNAAVAPGATVEWRFTDAEPWHLRINGAGPGAAGQAGGPNPAATVAPGPADNPDLVFRCRFEDWLDLIAGRIDPRRALLTGRIRPRGKLRMLVRAQRLFT